jgi:signal transduction histidine kinase
LRRLLAAWVLLVFTASAWAILVLSAEPVKRASLEAQLDAPEGVALQAARGVELPHRWDDDFRGRSGRAIYRMELPAVEVGIPYALYFPRAGNQVEVRVNSAVVARRGVIGSARHDAAKAPWAVELPTGLLYPDAPNELVVEISAQPSRWAGLAAPIFGPAVEVLPMFERRYAWRQFGAVAAVLCMGLMAILSFALWRVQGDALYGYFAAASAAGVLRFGDRLLPEPPVPWGLWSIVMMAALVMHLMWMIRFVAEMVQGATPRWTWLWRTCFLAALALGALAYVAHIPQLWTFGTLLALPSGAWALWLVLREAAAKREPQMLALASVGGLVVVAAVWDWLQARVFGQGSSSLSVLPAASLAFVLLLGWRVIDRYAGQIRANQELLATLDDKVAQREQELAASYAQMQREREERAALAERERLMRDLHDGVGAQLVGLLSLIQGQSSPQALEDLGTVLATLRYRLAPRLKAADLELQWAVDEVDAIKRLTPADVLNVQRIVLEALTNVVRHAQASRVVVGLRDEGDDVVLSVADDGRGIDHCAAQGHGLRNLQARAHALGARLSVEPAAPGTRVLLRLPRTLHTNASTPSATIGA